MRRAGRIDFALELGVVSSKGRVKLFNVYVSDEEIKDGGEKLGHGLYIEVFLWIEHTQFAGM